MVRACLAQAGVLSGHGALITKPLRESTMKPYEITEDIFIVGGPDISDRRDGCVYLINLGDLVLIDSGAGWSADSIINNIRILTHDPKKLTTLLLTHCHIDHIGGAPEIRRRLGARIFIHNLDAPALENGDPGLDSCNMVSDRVPADQGGCEAEFH